MLCNLFLKKPKKSEYIDSLYDAYTVYSVYTVYYTGNSFKSDAHNFDKH